MWYSSISNGSSDYTTVYTGTSDNVFTLRPVSRQPAYRPNWSNHNHPEKGRDDSLQQRNRTRPYPIPKLPPNRHKRYNPNGQVRHVQASHPVFPSWR